MPPNATAAVQAAAPRMLLLPPNPEPAAAAAVADGGPHPLVDYSMREEDSEDAEDDSYEDDQDALDNMLHQHASFSDITPEQQVWAREHPFYEDARKRATLSIDEYSMMAAKDALFHRRKASASASRVESLQKHKNEGTTPPTLVVPLPASFTKELKKYPDHLVTAVRANAKLLSDQILDGVLDLRREQHAKIERKVARWNPITPADSVGLCAAISKFVCTGLQGDELLLMRCVLLDIEVIEMVDAISKARCYKVFTEAQRKRPNDIQLDDDQGSPETPAQTFDAQQQPGQGGGNASTADAAPATKADLAAVMSTVAKLQTMLDKKVSGSHANRSTQPPASCSDRGGSGGTKTRGGNARGRSTRRVTFSPSSGRSSSRRSTSRTPQRQQQQQQRTPRRRKQSTPRQLPRQRTQQQQRQRSPSRSSRGRASLRTHTQQRPQRTEPSWREDRRTPSSPSPPRRQRNAHSPHAPPPRRQQPRANRSNRRDDTDFGDGQRKAQRTR